MNTLITLGELAVELGLDRSNLRKFAVKNGINMTKTRTIETRGQLTLAFTPEDAEAIRELRQTMGFVQSEARRAVITNGAGFFYIIQVIPEFAPNRVKLGFAGDVQARLSAHRTSAPTAQLLKSWPAKRYWEAVIIDSITRVDCENIANEIFECGNLEALIKRADDFFELMPNVK